MNGIVYTKAINMNDNPNIKLAIPPIAVTFPIHFGPNLDIYVPAQNNNIAHNAKIVVLILAEWFPQPCSVKISVI